MKKESDKENSEIDGLKHLVEKKKIQNEALRKIINKLNESDHKNQIR